MFAIPDYLKWFLTLIFIIVSPSIINNVNASKYKNTTFTYSCQFNSENCKATLSSYADGRIKRFADSGDEFILADKEGFLRTLFRENKCTPSVTLHRCNTEFSDDPKWIWRRVTEYYIHAIAERKCKSTTLSYTWTLYDAKTNKYIGHFPGFKDKTTFVLKYYALGTGSYQLKVKVSEVAKGKKKGSGSAKCLITIKPEDPIPKIKGGSKRTVPSGKEFSMVGQESINMDVAPGNVAYLNYQWFCTEGPKHLCNNKVIDKINDIIIPAKEAIDGTTFVFLLKVSTDEKQWFSTKQTVKVKKNARLVYINCLKNCGLTVNYRSVTYLRAYCDDCPKDSYEWSMTPAPNNKKTTINFATETSFGKSNPKLAVKEGVLQPDDIYTFNVIYDGGNSESSEEIKVTRLPKKGNCEAVPTEGKSLTTLFKITCNGFKDANPLTYRLFQRDSEIGGQGVLLAANEEGKFQLYLSAGKSGSTELIVRVGNADGLYIEIKLTLSVTSVIADTPVKKQTQKLLDVYEGKDTDQESIKSLIAKGDTEGAIQMINILTAEARHIPDTAEGFAIFHKNWKALITEDLQQISWESQDVLRQVASTIKNLKWADKDIIDREFAKTATKLCKEVAEKQINNVMQSPNREIMTEDTVELSQDLLWCADTNMKANLTDIESDDTIFNITTAHPLLPIPIITENYQNYDDDAVNLKRAEKMRDYKEITANGMDTFTLTGVAIAETLAPGEPIKQIDKYTNILQATKDEAQLLPEKSLGGFDSSVHASKGLAKWKTDAAIGVVTAYEQNPFWWDAEAKNFSAHVLDVNYFVNTRKVRNLKKPMELLFDVNKTEPDMISGNVSVPKDFCQWTPEKLDHNMAVHRVDVIKGAALRIEFFGLDGKDAIQVVVTYNRRPFSEDFKNAKTLRPNKATLMAPFPKKMLTFGDAWFYIAVLPDKSMIDAPPCEAKEAIREFETDIFTYNYKVAFTSPLCVYWNGTLKKWSSVGCRTGRKTTLKKLECSCSHRSAYSGIYLNASNKLDPILEVRCVLSLTSSCVIFICVCIIFGIYCTALIFAARKRRKVRATPQIFFLGDNAGQERYAYLVIVKTGDIYSAGTTSNVGMKVFGKKFRSRAHVINYPDPDKKLLQRGNEDWFILTTERYLGKIKYIMLWHDSIGLRPSWNCEWVSIIDLQTHKAWYFNVQKWFSVLKEELRCLPIKPSQSKPIHSWRYNWTRKYLTSITREHSWNICKFNEESDLSYIQRITIMLSVILTTYSLALMMYGTPAMRFYDGFGYGHYHVYPITILVAFFSSLLSFFLNLGITVLFRKLYYKNKNELEVSKHKCSPSSSLFPWFLLCTTVVACLTFLIVFGFWVAYVTSLLWISSTIGALIQTVLLVENIYILVKVTIWDSNSKSTIRIVKTSEIVQETEKQRNKFYPKFGYLLLRPYFSTKYRPLTREEWKIRKEREIRRLKITELLQDLIMFAIYIILLYVVVLANKDSLNIYSHNEMKSLVYGEHTRTINYENIDNVNDFYEYVNKTLIPNIHSSNWYGTYELIEPGLMADFNIKIIGVARFRQLRICKNCCEVPSKVRELNMTCLPEFSYWYNDIGEYMEYWKFKQDTLIPRLIGTWKYQYDAVPSIGELTIYTGGGYSAPLGRTLYNSYYNLKYYKDTKWFDERSRVVHIEFLAYNVNYNIFHAVKLLVERSASGLFIKTLSICTTRLLFVQLELAAMILVSFAAFITIIFFMFFKNVYTATKNWKTYFRKAWNIVDIIIILMSFSCIGMYLHRIYLVGDLLHQLEVKKRNVFISYFDLIYMEEALTLLASVLICVATVRLWKSLRFGVKFKIMEKTLMLSSRPLFAVAFYHLNILIMFSLSGYISFGAQSQDFRNLTATLTTLVLLSLNLHENFDYNFLNETLGGYIYYTLYMLISTTIFTLYIAVIVLSYNESGNYYSKLKPYYSVQNYVYDESRYFTELIQRRLKNVRLAGGADDVHNTIPNKKATPKGDEFRYANSVVVPTYKIFVMSLIARCVVLNYVKGSKKESVLSSYEANLMKQTIFHLLSNQETSEPNSIAFTSFDENNKITLVSNNRILKMEYVVNYILDEGTAKNSKIELFEDVDESVISGRGGDEQLEYFEDVLKSILNVFNNINIATPES